MQGAGAVWRVRPSSNVPLSINFWEKSMLSGTSVLLGTCSDAGSGTHGRQEPRALGTRGS